MNSIIDKLNDGGPAFTYIIMLAFLVLIGLFVRGIIIKGDKYKTIELMKSISWFAVAWGFLGRTFGLISIFDKVQAMGDVAPSVFADGLKIALVAPLCGILVFALTRLGIVVLIQLQKDFKPQENN
ncbi:MotA/TolQ/ExbB proton channel family protein [Draconibacterium halophilum]|uniref:MotA/TolQ/ExbB proton channel family protein n=1 Tax=Draconibacterium halophilum TaxID=2706887 RepID=A0A6C0RC76_9BACT|nr:MotA/TolQ/ExbB proton channel family protein [Draconibacterium halophilum]QIA07626.1 MotA/TolQ/ExbB proton channel family protein [Draconibacterium halophilum]